MSPLHTDYRPLDLDDIVGNKETIESLKIHLQKQKPNRSLLVTGPAGVGKTTLAMCVANHLCQMDRWNYHMLNSADFRGIDTVREVRELAHKTPLGASKERVWILEEIHRVSVDGAEALLKLLEDPPEHCWFLLTTTNPEKLKVTLKRRCTEFSMKPLGERELLRLLMSVCKKEDKTVPLDVLQQICQDSIGSAGIALNVLDKVIDLPESSMKAMAQSWIEQSNTVILLCRTLLKMHRQRKSHNVSWNSLCTILKDLEDQDPETLRRQILAYFRKVILDGDVSILLILDEFKDPYYDVGPAGLAMSLARCFLLFLDD